MAFTNSTIVAAVNEWLEISLTTTSSAFLLARRQALHWLSEREKWSCLHVLDNEESLSANDNQVAWPTGFRELDCIVLNDGETDSKPLEECSFDEIKRDRADTPLNTGEPSKFSQRGKVFELNKDCDQAYTAKVSYWRYHPDQEEILFGEEFKWSLYYATCAAYLEGKGRHSKALYYWQLAKSKLPKQKKETKPRKKKFRDL